MDESIRLGRIAGIHIGMNWSLLVIAWLIAWSLAGQQLPAEYPGYATSAYWTAGILASIVFFASLLAHEMSHALQARRENVEVEGITLWLFGGVARMRGEAMSAGGEFRITIAGPLSSLSIALVFFLLGLALDAANASELLVGTFFWLARINAVLAAFNMIPAFPLDGGRVFRAWLWRKKGDKTRATVVAARVGRGFGYLLVAIGLIDFAVNSEFGGLWFVLLGYFLTTAARSEESHVLLRGALVGLQVRDIMSSDVVSVPAWTTVQTFIDEYATRHRFSAFPTHDFDGRTEGLVTLARVQDAPHDERADARVRDYAYRLVEVPTARPREPLTDLLERSAGSEHCRSLVIDEEGALVGIVSPRDISRALDLASLRGARLPSGVGPRV